ncbi:MAG: hypothetical protein IRZ03_06665 [Acidobacterium ailaaui]|nr:hypothetical protein [Pseudacidobacterium ailaaui]
MVSRWIPSSERFSTMGSKPVSMAFSPFFLKQEFFGLTALGSSLDRPSSSGSMVQWKHFGKQSS